MIIYRSERFVGYEVLAGVLCVVALLNANVDCFGKSFINAGDHGWGYWLSAIGHLRMLDSTPALPFERLKYPRNRHSRKQIGSTRGHSL